MKLPKQLTLEREAFISDAFRTIPSLSIRAAQALVVGKFGRQMRPHRLLEIRRNVLTGNHAPDKVQP